MSAIATLGAVGVSLAALGYLAATDPKRRRAFRLQPADRRHGRSAWAIALLPGLALPAFSGAGGFVVWFGATTVAGWALAATSPERIAGGQRLLSRVTCSMRRATGIGLRSGGADRPNPGRYGGSAGDAREERVAEREPSGRQRDAQKDRLLPA